MADTLQITEHMPVFGSDGERVGTVDRIEGDRIKLTKSGPASRGAHCYIGLEWVETVDDDGVQLSCAAEDVRRMQAPQPSAD